uniref:Uncharacterized protein n=1 Tax=Knipowitschia caucasica TaxID=637954 RepID=A0AAV2MIA8_KNICA
MEYAAQVPQPREQWHPHNSMVLWEQQRPQEPAGPWWRGWSTGNSRDPSQKSRGAACGKLELEVEGEQTPPQEEPWCWSPQGRGEVEEQD